MNVLAKSILFCAAAVLAAPVIQTTAEENKPTLLETRAYLKKNLEEYGDSIDFYNMRTRWQVLLEEDVKSIIKEIATTRVDLTYITRFLSMDQCTLIMREIYDEKFKQIVKFKFQDLSIPSVPKYHSIVILHGKLNKTALEYIRSYEMNEVILGRLPRRTNSISITFSSIKPAANTARAFGRAISLCAPTINKDPFEEKQGK